MEISLFQVPLTEASIKKKLLAGLLIVSMLTISGCSLVNSSGSSQIYKEGYILDKSALDSISVGSSQEQVILTLGTPSLKTKYDNEVFYYISQTRYRGMQFMKTKIIDRKVLAIYFDKNKQVTKVAHYGLQDGQMFDFITRTTPTPTKERPFLLKIIKGL
ncbi:outer membrane protein assembly factor BamE [Bartonella doshiae]|uniref:outer membrane protein assembly factor BamE n=1 Tax=Bartonella doshiae TaxID=33044 RepID=UPI000945D7FA|nr:outer membrane protein assembly factor BamE [Bartonella doshiae]